MSNADNFEDDIETTADEELGAAGPGEGAPAEGEHEEAAPMEAEAEPGAEPGGDAEVAPKKPGGGLFKVVILLVVLGAAGAAGAAKMGFISVPGLSPDTAAATHPAGVKKLPVTMASDAAPEQPETAPGIQPAAGADASPPAGMNAPPPAAIAPPPAITGTAPNAPAGGSMPPSLQPAGIEPPAMESAKPAAAAADAKMQELEQKLSTLEQDLSALKGDAVKKSDLDALKTDIDGKMQAMMAAAKAAAEQKPAESEKTAEGAEKSAAVHHHHHDRATAAMGVAHRHGGTHRSTVAAGWVLKSAKPGAAWVSQPGSSEIRTISVGDALPGVGKITAIDKNAEGRWTVTGTRGSINQ